MLNKMKYEVFTHTIDNIKKQVRKTTIKHTALSLFLALDFTASAQENTAPQDFDLPKNTEMALEITGIYDSEKHAFKQTNAKEYRFNSNGQLAQVKEMVTNGIGSQDTYHYDANGELLKMDYLLGTNAGPISGSSTHSIEKESYKTTYIRKDQNGDMLRTIAFFNEAGELRGKSFYNARGEKEKQIEYDGKKAHRTKKYKGNKIVSDIVYENNKQGKLEKKTEYTEPGKTPTKEQLTTIRYNKNGDAETMLIHYETEAGKQPKVMNTHTMEYLYDGDMWVARIEYRHGYYKPSPTLNITLRRIKTADKMYTAKDEKAVLDFCKQAYQHYLNTEKQTK